MSFEEFAGDNELSGLPSPSQALVILPRNEESDEFDLPAWRTILSDSYQVVLYNSDSHALSVRPQTSVPASLRGCPYCHRPYGGAANEPLHFEHQHTRAPNYFQLLEVANDINSRPSSSGRPGLEGSNSSNSDSRMSNGRADSSSFRADAMAEGYFSAFFKEEYRLGMGANGSVFLCQVSRCSLRQLATTKLDCDIC